MNRDRNAASRFAERRRLEDEAPRLREAIPQLATCKILIEEGRAESTTAEVSHTRHVVVDRASTMFVVPCGDPACKDGGYDISSDLMRGFRNGKTEIRGEDTCHGHTGMAGCGRLLRFCAMATYT